MPGFYCDACCTRNEELSKQVISVSKKYTRTKVACAVLATLLSFSLAANVAFMCVH
jgi:hypothetical protein